MALLKPEIILRGPEQKKRTHLVSLGEYYSKRLQEYGEQVAIVQEVDGKEVSVTYLELLRHGKIIAGFLRERGLVSGGTVMLCCGNTLDYSRIMLGTLFVGAAISPINPAFDTNDLLHLIQVIKPQLVISNTEAAPCLQEALTKHDQPVQFITLEAVNSRIQENQPVDDFHLAKVDDPSTHVAFIMCSSGTSGKPKGVEMAHSKLLYELSQLEIIPQKFRKRKRSVVILNMSGPFWVTCLLSTNFSLSEGIKLVLLTPFTEETFLKTVEKFKVNFVLLGPDQLLALAKYPAFDRYDVSSLDTILYGGAPMSRAMLELGQAKLQQPITVAYGMTECMSFLQPAYGVKDKPCNVGILAPNVLAKVIDLETGATVGPNCEGELCFKMDKYSFFKGYRGNPQATQDMFDDAGFLHTGDVGYYDKDGYFFICDRIKELIKYRRDHVPATDIEEVMLQHPEVQDAAVIGVYHEVDWEHATAIVRLKPGATTTDKELLKLVEASLPQFKWLHGGIHFVESLPKTPSGKIQKHKLRQMYGKRPDA